MKTGTCRVCDGPIVYYPRPADQAPPRTSAVNDDNRWAHTRIADFINNHHRAQPQETV